MGRKALKRPAYGSGVSLSIILAVVTSVKYSVAFGENIKQLEMKMHQEERFTNSGHLTVERGSSQSLPVC